MQCVILAGGRGTRMDSYTAQIPKALIPAAGKPFIDYLLAHLARSGVTSVLLSIGYRGAQIKEHVKEGSSWGIPVTYVDEGATPRGTAGALQLALDKGLLEDAFLLTYGDAFLPIDFSDVWRYFQSRSEPVLMTVFHNANRWQSSNVIFDGDKVTLYKKGGKEAAMTYLDYGLLGLRRSFVENDVSQDCSNLAEVLGKISLRGDIAGLEIQKRPYEIGTPEGLKDFTNFIQGAH